MTAEHARALDAGGEVAAVGSGLLFAAPIQSRETDERYTPAWIFEALGETFDLDPASPPLGVSRVPTAAVWTKDDDGLTSPWHGFVWLNPPFSHSKAWADRFMAHGNGIWLGPVANGGWHDEMTRKSDAMVLLRDFAFIGINHAQKRSSMPLSMHGFGPRAVAALRRFAERQPDAGVLLARATRQAAADAVLAEARRLCCGENPAAHHAATDKHSELMAFAGRLAEAVRGR